MSFDGLIVEGYKRCRYRDIRYSPIMNDAFIAYTYCCRDDGVYRPVVNSKCRSCVENVE